MPKPRTLVSSAIILLAVASAACAADLLDLIVADLDQNLAVQGEAEASSSTGATYIPTVLTITTRAPSGQPPTRRLCRSG